MIVHTHVIISGGINNLSVLENKREIHKVNNVKKFIILIHNLMALSNH